MEDTTIELIARFKRQPFGKGLLPFGPTLRSLETNFPRVYAAQQGRQRWVVRCTMNARICELTVFLDLRYYDE